MTEVPRPARPEITWRHVDEVGSTNEDLLDAPFADVAQGPVVLWADRQNAGRGRRGRRWVSDPSRALTFSIALERRVRRGDLPLAGFSLAVGVALAESLVDEVPDIQVKWPNDLLRPAGKVAGILIESRRSGAVERVVVGIGLNLLAPADPDALDLPAGALAPAGLFTAATLPDAETLLRRCAQATRAAFDEFVQTGLPAFTQRWQRFDATAGRQIVLRDAGRVLAQGIALGLDAQGALRIRTSEGEQAYSIGEVSLRFD